MPLPPRCQLRCSRCRLPLHVRLCVPMPLVRYDGICMTKAIYKHLHTANITNLPDQGSRSITNGCSKLLHKIWRSKCIPPLLKTFAWRLIRRTLAAADRATRYSVNGNNTCDRCNMIETVSHLFFHCTLPT